MKIKKTTDSITIKNDSRVLSFYDGQLLSDSNRKKTPKDVNFQVLFVSLPSLLGFIRILICINEIGKQSDMIKTWVTFLFLVLKNL